VKEKHPINILLSDEYGECLKSREVQTISKTGGMRYNGAKARLSVVPPELEEAVAQVLWASAKENGGKYPMNNWKKGLPLTETVDSALRHLKAFVHSKHEGDLDPESGLHHLKHAATNIAFLLHFIANEQYGELDDRYKK